MSWRRRRQVTIPEPSQVALPKVWIGTMFCDEGDFAKSKESITNQAGVDVRHHVIVHMPEKEAHNALWRAWREFRDKNPQAIFVKVDADTVLRHKQVLSTIVDIFANNARVTGIQCPLDDYFTGGHINGLNCFGPKVIFNDTGDDLFCDRNVDVNHDVVLRAPDLPESLTPAAKHCMHATPTQAFHFGLHRMLKGQYHVIDQVRSMWKVHGDKIRGMALLGAKNAHTVGRRFNYTDRDFVLLSYEVNKNYHKLIKEL